MKQIFRQSVLAIAVASAGLAAAPAQAVQIAFTGSSNIGNLVTVDGDDGIGDTWQTHNDASGNSNFGMSDLAATPQPFNPVNFSNSLGNFANAFQFTINQSQAPTGFRGLLTAQGTAPLSTHFTTMPDPMNAATWVDWTIQYYLPDANTGLFQQVLFTAPTGTQLSQGEYFHTNINIAGIFTADAGWAASFIDNLPAVRNVPEPATLGLLGLALLGPIVARRRNTKPA